MRAVWWWMGFLSILAGGGLLFLRASHDAPLETVDLSDRSAGAPAMCPWRNPAQDMQVFFPGTTAYRTETLVLTSLRGEITRRLGPGIPLDENALYVHRVLRKQRPVGTVLVRRVAGQHGAIELVIGVGKDGRVTGARLQRQREPAPVARALLDARWLDAFRGKSAASSWEVGRDIPAVPADAKVSAQAVAGAARSLLIELAVAEDQGHAAHH